MRIGAANQSFALLWIPFFPCVCLSICVLSQVDLATCPMSYETLVQLTPTNSDILAEYLTNQPTDHRFVQLTTGWLTLAQVAHFSVATSSNQSVFRSN